MIIRIILSFIFIFFSVNMTFSAPVDKNLREITIGDTGHTNNILDNFFNPLSSYFFAPSGDYGNDGIMGMFTTIAYNIKNFFIAVAALFLMFAVIKLLFSSNDEESVKKWRSSIIWTSVGIFVMQISFSIWEALVLRFNSDLVGSSLGWQFWEKVFAPVVNTLQLLASLGFLFMAIWAFFILVSAGGDEEKAKKSKNTILYAIIGFLLIKIPEKFITAIYGDIANCNGGLGQAKLTCIKNPEISDAVGIVGKIFNFFNTFLSVICVILVIYAAWLVLISGGDEEKLKKAKHTILYIVIGFVLLVASHAIFRFFILKG